jgi:hypothetical protein
LRAGGFFYDSQLRKRGAAAVRDASELGSVSSTHLEELTSIASRCACVCGSVACLSTPVRATGD